MLGKTQLNSLAAKYLSQKEAFSACLKEGKGTKTKEEMSKFRKELTKNSEIGKDYKQTKDAFKKGVVSTFCKGSSKEEVLNTLNNNSLLIKKIEKWYGKFQEKSQK